MYARSDATFGGSRRGTCWVTLDLVEKGLAIFAAHDRMPTKRRETSAVEGAAGGGEGGGGAAEERVARAGARGARAGRRRRRREGRGGGGEGAGGEGGGKGRKAYTNSFHTSGECTGRNCASSETSLICRGHE